MGENMDSVFYFFAVLGIILLIIEVIAIIFKVTGLGLDRARFQVISILTHTGFTTKESELIVQHPLRKRIASYLMIVSYVGQATLISVIVNMIRDKNGITNFIIILVVLSFIILFFVRNKFFLTRFDRIIEKRVLHQMKVNKKYRNVDEVLKLNDEYGVAEIIIGENSPLCNRTLKDSNLKEQYIQVLNIDKGSRMVHFPRADFIFEEGDKITVYGKIERIKELILEKNTCEISPSE